MLHLINQTKLLFWKKMYTNSNVLLYILSRYSSAPSRFMAVASQYGIHSLQQTVGTVKLLCGSLLRRQFMSKTRVFCFIFCTVRFCVCSVCFVFVFYAATFWCNEINK